jgi:hypothetical protein
VCNNESARIDTHNFKDKSKLLKAEGEKKAKMRLLYGLHQDEVTWELTLASCTCCLEPHHLGALGNTHLWHTILSPEASFHLKTERCFGNIYLPRGIEI